LLYSPAYDDRIIFAPSENLVIRVNTPPREYYAGGHLVVEEIG
jgi:hypothetical protein